MSDARLKKDITPPPEEAHKLAEEARIIEFAWKDDLGGRRLGVIAQELQEVYPQAVKQDASGYLTVDYSQISLATTLKVQELCQRVQELENEVKNG